MAGLSLLDVVSASPLEAAPRLLGARFTHGGVTVRVTEVEAYAGPDDPGPHAARGRTPRNAVMFGPPAHLYVYFTYGMHFCCNVSCGPDGEPGAVLLRAGEVVEGVEAARLRRPRGSERDLARGPARLCSAMGIGRGEDGLDVSGAFVLGPPAYAVSTGPRVGLRLAAERPWRFWLPGEPTVSRYVPAKPRPRRDPA